MKMHNCQESLGVPILKAHSLFGSGYVSVLRLSISLTPFISWVSHWVWTAAKSLTIISKNIWFPPIKLEIALKNDQYSPWCSLCLPKGWPFNPPTLSSQQQSFIEEAVYLVWLLLMNLFSLTWINLFFSKQNNNLNSKKKIILNREQLESLKPLRILMISLQEDWRRKKTWNPEEVKEGETQRNVSEGGGANGNGSEINKGYRNVMEGAAQVRTIETI